MSVKVVAFWGWMPTKADTRLAPDKKFFLKIMFELMKGNPQTCKNILNEYKASS